MSTITIDSLSKRYGNVVALRDVSIDVRDGEFLTILGPSGSGKTTMLLSIAGFETPTGGTIRFDGRDVTDLPPHKRRVGLTFQSYALFPHMSVEKNVGFPLRVRGVSKSEIARRVHEALVFVQLDGYEHRRPAELSGGQQQRVALARAFVFEPDTLLLDEPLAALDRQLRQTVQIELRELQRSLGITTIAVTHDQEEALTMSDRILVLRDGEVQQHGSPRDVYERPQTRFVASFLGTANLFDGLVIRNGPFARLHCEEQGIDFPVPNVTQVGPATAMVRPEHIHIHSPSAIEGIPGEIKSVVYLGAFVRYYVAIASGGVAQVTGPRINRYGVGQNVRISWDPNDVWIIPEEEEYRRTPRRLDESTELVPRMLTNGAVI
jgi:putative spermidine/putrescine transport system ATP-binding protein